MAMVPPTVTHQEKQVRVAGGKPVFYEPPELKAARQKLVAYLGQHVPDEPYHCGVRLITNGASPGENIWMVPTDFPNRIRTICRNY